MLNRSESNDTPCADARTAQQVRGAVIFGSVFYAARDRLSPGEVLFEPGYADCLPVVGGCWRDPISHDATELLR